jgi:predicted transcriptional regulator
MRKRKKIEVRLGTLDDMRQDVNRLFDDPGRVEEEPERIIYVPPKDLPKLLSEERVRLIHEIRRGDYTINKLAAKLKRKRENISRDLNILEEYGMVEIHRTGREGHPKTKSQITITI